jgi:hypothetical protein
MSVVNEVQPIKIGLSLVKRSDLIDQYQLTQIIEHSAGTAQKFILFSREQLLDLRNKITEVLNEPGHNDNSDR